jgi:hypothetical protein
MRWEEGEGDSCRSKSVTRRMRLYKIARHSRRGVEGRACHGDETTSAAARDRGPGAGFGDQAHPRVRHVLTGLIAVGIAILWATSQSECRSVSHRSDGHRAPAEEQGGRVGVVRRDVRHRRCTVGICVPPREAAVSRVCRSREPPAATSADCRTKDNDEGRGGVPLELADAVDDSDHSIWSFPVRVTRGTRRDTTVINGRVPYCRRWRSRALRGAVIAVGWNHPRPRRVQIGHCRKCGYDLTGIDGVCPECGSADSRKRGRSVPG